MFLKVRACFRPNLGNGSHFRFWLDDWTGSGVLQAKVPAPFSVGLGMANHDPSILVRHLVARVLREIINPSVSRTLRPPEILDKFSTYFITDQQMGMGWPMILC